MLCCWSRHLVGYGVQSKSGIFDIGFFVHRVFCRLGCETNWTKKTISTLSGVKHQNSIILGYQICGINPFTTLLTGHDPKSGRLASMLIIRYHRTHTCFSQYQGCNRIVQYLTVPNSIRKY